MMSHGDRLLDSLHQLCIPQCTICSFIETMCRLYHVTPDQADKIFLFGIKGAFAVNKAMDWKKDDEWFQVQKVLLTFLAGGYEALHKL